VPKLVQRSKSNEAVTLRPGESTAVVFLEFMSSMGQIMLQSVSIQGFVPLSAGSSFLNGAKLKKLGGSI
jgi:hypothetical protein